MKTVRSQRPPMKELQIEETEMVLLKNTLDQFRSFLQQQQTLHDQFDVVNKPGEEEGRRSGNSQTS